MPPLKLKSAGIPEAQAKAEAEALATALGESALGASSDFPTKADVTGIKIEIADVKAELKIVKWTSATIVAGVIALIMKAFF